MLDTSYDWSKLGVTMDEVVDYNNSIDNIAMIQNVLHVLSALNNKTTIGNGRCELNFESLINLFCEMEDMAAEALDTFDCFQIKSESKDDLGNLTAGKDGITEAE